ncbi:MAG: polysaccharide pyruvyl transferase family protein [Fuerstiella sp.]
MKAIFINDTSGTSNPGCQGTVACLLQLLMQSGVNITSRSPVGYCYHEFAQCDVAMPLLSLQQRIMRRITKAVSASKPVVAAAPKLCPERWNHSIEQFAARIEPVWAEADQLIVNGEGTIHHDAIGARNLIGLCLAGKKLGKRISILNCSIYDLSETLLAALRDSVDQIIVREPISHRYLNNQGIQSTLAADCLFLAAQRKNPDVVLPKTIVDQVADKARVAVYTPGVLSGTGQVTGALVQNDIQQLKDTGYKVLYYVVEAEDEHLASAAKQAGAAIIPLGAMNWMELLTFMKSVSLVVSGRYHINIFAAICGVSFLPMQTNTSKMDGLLELLGHASQSVRALDNEHNTLNFENCIHASAEVTKEICNQLQTVAYSEEFSA